MKFIAIVILFLAILATVYVHYLERMYVHDLVTKNNELSSLLMDLTPLNITLDAPLKNKVVPSIEDFGNWLQKDSSSECEADNNFAITVTQE